MAKKYTGSLTLEWYNKQKAILLQSQEQAGPKDIPAPRINWINKEEALFYEIDEKEGKGLVPYWVDRNDIRVKEARPLIFQKAYKAVPKNKKGSLPGTEQEWKVEDLDTDDPEIENILIKGDNLLALNTIKKLFENKPEEEKVKCIYIDPPYNTGSAFQQYDDNLAHSEWLTLMRDRFLILKQLLRRSGVIFVQLDEKEYSYCRLLLDEIFGFSNFVGDLIWQKRKGGGNDSRFVALDHDYIAIYVLNSNLENHPDKWRIAYEEEYLKRYKEIDEFGNRYYWDTLNRDNLQNPIKFEIKCPDNSIIMLNSQKAKETVLEELKSGHIRFTNSKNGWSLHHRVYLPKGKVLRSIIFHDSILTDSGTNKEANDEQKEIFSTNGFDYPKPEKIVKNLIELVSNETDLILDCFGGSGTTFAVAHKMNRRWIGVEIGDHADTHIVKRMKSVLDGSDQSGISKSVNWTGGGSFKYYHLGESIIKMDKDGKGDFNWKLGKSQIEESFLASYDYRLENLDLSHGQLFKDKENRPKVGIQKIGNKTRVAVISLEEPKKSLGLLSFEDTMHIYDTLKKQYSPEYINIFTNRGVEIAADSKPEILEIIKVPQAIFAELEK